MTEPSTERLFEAFGRQRRLLIPVSLTLTLYLAAGIRLEEVTILGNTFTLAKPGWVPGALALAWLYLLLRYYQYFRDLPKGDLTAAFNDRVVARLRDAAIARAKKEVRAEVLGEGGKGPVSFGTFTSAPAKNAPIPTEYAVAGWVRYYGESGMKSRQFSGHEVAFTPLSMAIPRFLAGLSLAMNTRFFTEYFLPFLIAVTPAVYWLWERFLRLRAT